MFYLDGGSILKRDIQSNADKKKIKGREKDPIWQNFTTIYNIKNQVVTNTCNRCFKEVSAKADRMKQHFNKCKKSSVPASSLNVPVSDCESASTSSGVKNPFLYEDTDKIIPLQTKKTQSIMDPFIKGMSSKSKDEADLALGRLMFSANLPFYILENKQLRDFVKILNPAYVIPSHDKIGSSVLNQVYTEVRGKMDKDLQNTKGVLLQDGWSTKQNQSVIAHCIKSGSNTYLLSTSQPMMEKSSAEYCYSLVKQAIQDSKKEFGVTIVGLVTDNCNTMMALQNLMKLNYPEIESYGCNAHLFNLIGRHFTPSDLQKNVNDVQVYIRNHHFTMAALKDLKANSPILPGTTRWNSQIDSFLNYKENQPNYLRIVRTIEKPKKTEDNEKLKQITSILNDPNIYSELDATIKVLKPVCIALDMVRINILTREQL